MPLSVPTRNRAEGRLLVVLGSVSLVRSRSRRAQSLGGRVRSKAMELRLRRAGGVPAVRGSLPHPAGGGPGLGWLRPVAVEVTGEPAPDGLLEAVEAHTLDEALAALPTDVEREALRAGAALFEVRRG